MRRSCLTLALSCFLFSIVNASTFYVGKTGDNAGPGTKDNPWLTIQKSADSLEAGDTVLILRGTYNEQVQPKKSGSPGKYITYKANPGDSVTLDGKGVTVDLVNTPGIFHITSRQYICVYGLRITNTTGFGLAIEGGTHIIFRKNYLNNIAYSGIVAWEAGDRNGNIIVDSNEVHYACMTGPMECISLARTDTFSVTNNLVDHGNAEGIDVKFGSNNGTIAGNTVHHTQRQCIYCDAWSDRTYNISVFNNTVYSSVNNDGIVCSSERGGRLENISYYNNISFNNACNGFRIMQWPGDTTGPIRNISVVNNTFSGNGTGLEPWGNTGGISIENPDIDTLVVRNNIVSQNTQYQIAEHLVAAHLTVDHNLIDGFRGFAKEIQGSDSIEGSPLFVKASQFDFHLTANSPAIDKGSSLDAPSVDKDGISRPHGSAVDIGAYEFENTGVKKQVLSNNLQLNNRSRQVELSLQGGPFATGKVYDIRGRLVREENMKSPLHEGIWVVVREK